MGTFRLETRTNNDLDSSFGRHGVGAVNKRLNSDTQMERISKSHLPCTCAVERVTMISEGFTLCLQSQ